MTPRLRERLLTMLITLGLLVAGGMALASVGSGSSTDTASDPTCSPTATGSPVPTDAATTDEGDGSTTVSTTDSVTDPTVDEGDDPTVDEGDGSTTDDGSCHEATAEPSPSEDGTEEGTHTQESLAPVVTTDPAREAECNTAAGVDPTADPAAESTRTTGLDNAIEHVLANCLKNPGAPGLPNALEHLVANAERKAAHDAAKAAGEHGNSGEHGPDAVHGNSGEHGNPHD
jgi:hypothetical protein